MIVPSLSSRFPSSETVFRLGTARGFRDSSYIWGSGRAGARLENDIMVGWLFEDFSTAEGHV